MTKNVFNFSFKTTDLEAKLEYSAGIRMNSAVGACEVFMASEQPELCHLFYFNKCLNTTYSSWIHPDNKAK